MNPAARVVPDVASFSVDEGFWYSIPDHLRKDVRIGTIVRIPLSGRKVRGWVVELGERDPGPLKDLAGVSGSEPVFDRSLLQSLRWAAQHYVAPLSAMFKRATPPNLPRKAPPSPSPPMPGQRDHPLTPVIERSARGDTSPVTAYVANWRQDDWLPAIGPILAAGNSVQVIAASVAEVEMLTTRAAQTWGDEMVVGVGGEDDASDTAAWEAAQVQPRLLVGTPKTAAWRISALALAFVLEEGRRAMKDRQAPTLHVRDVMRTRSRVEGFNLVFMGPTPSVELLAAGAEVIADGKRPWALVEVVDRSQESPGSGFISDRTFAAIRATADVGKRVFVFTHRRVGFASTRCAHCRLLRTCSQCEARLRRGDRCRRCGSPAGPCARCGGMEFEEMGTVPERLVSELNRRAGSTISAVHPGSELVTVGTERDLAGLETVHLAVAADVDGMLTGHGYRTSEEALRQLGRLASMVATAHGARIMLQTTHPDSSLVTALRRGQPIPYLEHVLVERAREGSPPSSDMITVELRGEIPDEPGEALADLGPEVVVLGPMVTEGAMRWLLTGNLDKTRQQLRKIAGRWRDRGVTVRIDVDPIDV